MLTLMQLHISNILH